MEGLYRRINPENPEGHINEKERQLAGKLMIDLKILKEKKMIKMIIDLYLEN